MMAKKEKPKTKEQLTFEAGYAAAVEEMNGQPDAKKMEQAFSDWKEENPRDTPLVKEWKARGMPSKMVFEGVLWEFVKEPSGKYSCTVSGELFGPVEE